MFKRYHRATPAQAVPLLRDVPLFSVLDNDAIVELARAVLLRIYRAGQPIFIQEDPGEEMYIILEGSVKIVRESLSGREITLAFLGKGNFFGDMALLDGYPRSASAYAVSDSKLLMLRRVDFENHLLRKPESARNLLRFLSVRLRRANSKIQDLALLTVRERLAAYLAELAEKEGTASETGILLPKEVNHSFLASALGTKRETISRIAAELRSLDLIAQLGRRIAILDINGLRNLVSEFSE